MSRKAGDTEKSWTAPTENTASRVPLGQGREGVESSDVTDSCVIPNPEVSRTLQEYREGCRRRAFWSAP